MANGPTPQPNPRFSASSQLAKKPPLLSGEEAILAQVNKALDLIDAEKIPEAESVCRRLLQKHPDHPHATRVLANAMILQRMFPQALHYLDRCAEIAPAGDSMYLFVVGRMRRQIMPDEASRDLFKRALDIDPANIDAWLSYCEILLMTGQYRDARDACVNGMKHAPDHPDIWHNKCVALQLLGRAEESYKEANDLVQVHPTYPPGRLIRSSTAMHAGGVSPQQIRDDARAYWVQRGARKGISKPLSAEAKARAIEAARNGQIRIGLISPDFREHSVAYFIEPLLRQWNKDRVLTGLYSTVPHEDMVTKRFASMAGLWRVMALTSVGALAERVRADDMHICIDLAGHTAGSAIASLAFEPALVQGSFCGWPGTTGLDNIDIRIVDSFTDPAGDPYEAQDHATERLVRLDPCFLCYRPPNDAPEVASGPAARGEPMTFGSFNALKKVSMATLDAWSRVLLAVPGSRFVVKTRALDDPGTHEDFYARLEGLGVERSRVELLHSAKTTRQHLELYSRVDVALDTFPYNGTTTTCEALLMGVPVVSVAGELHASRVGLSLLNNAALGHLCAKNVDEYVKIAAKLAKDSQSLVEFRTSLRPKLLASALCDQEAYSARFEKAMREAILANA